MALPNDNFHGFDAEADKYSSDINNIVVGNTPPNFANAGTLTLSTGYAFCDIDLDGDVDLGDVTVVTKHTLELNEIEASDGTQYTHFLEVLSYYDPDSVDGTLSKTSNNGPCMSLRRIRDEYKGTSGTASFSDYYRNGSYVPNFQENAFIPTSGTVSFDDFYGTKKQATVTYEIIGGGGEGAGGSYGGNGASGGATSLASSSGTSFTTVYSLGGAGGSGYGPSDGTWVVGQAGEASYYGPGGAGGLNSDSGNQSPGYNAPSTSYGAGGGGGGAAPFNAYNGGARGEAADRVTGTLELNPGSVITVTIGTGGAAIAGGGNGAGGYAKITVNGVATTYTSSGTYTVPS